MQIQTSCLHPHVVLFLLNSDMFLASRPPYLCLFLILIFTNSTLELKKRKIGTKYDLDSPHTEDGVI